MVTAFETRDKVAFRQSSNAFVALLRAQDELLATRKEFMLGTWLEAAKAMARTDAERALYEKNARTQITYWGPDNPTTELHDYANKEWSGLLSDFYLPRWEMFIADLNAQLDGKPAAEVNYFKFEKQWTEQHNQFLAAPVGDPVEAATRILGTLH
jgi:alpha-N-acetylglucosaminidase